ncbi:DUF2017 domain-containing protein [Naumannella cuiyingiana]|uniref:DUF2017 domain-containing protein n=1 Tax=Naumannella cuiyingiana TaxID=1347891 RepID=A0A7Z0IK52_9ACTN|nr:DUF2017 domain-containing protein [Naumannella cuiyingiana]NYI70161.1 hypothetical protein [Naumannella cuiyingiana]
MRRFTRKGSVLTARMSEAEVAMLASLIGQLVELTTDALGEPAAESADPLERLSAELSAEPDEPEQSGDPVIQRLFPNPYPHDPQAASDYRRYTQADLRDQLVAHARQVLDDLAASGSGSRPVAVAEADVDSWLKVLTALRLSLAARLGVSDAEGVEELAALPEDDARAYLYSVFEWLGFAQETLVGSL